MVRHLRGRRRGLKDDGTSAAPRRLGLGQRRCHADANGPSSGACWRSSAAPDPAVQLSEFTLPVPRVQLPCLAAQFSATPLIASITAPARY
jgi:hypothetical protein